jgi:hypothetical protein
MMRGVALAQQHMQWEKLREPREPRAAALTFFFFCLRLFPYQRPTSEPRSCCAVPVFSVANEKRVE